jgi:hypothetical protein
MEVIQDAADDRTPANERGARRRRVRDGVVRGVTAGRLSLLSALASLPVLRETSARSRPCLASATDQRSGGDREVGDAAPDAADAAS